MMKYDYRGLISSAARKITKCDSGTAYALYELADNLSVLLKGGCSLDDFKERYVGWDQPKFICDGLMPGEEGYEQREVQFNA